MSRGVLLLRVTSMTERATVPGSALPQVQLCIRYGTVPVFFGTLPQLAQTATLTRKRCAHDPNLASESVALHSLEGPAVVLLSITIFVVCMWVGLAPLSGPRPRREGIIFTWMARPILTFSALAFLIKAVWLAYVLLTGAAMLTVREEWIEARSLLGGRRRLLSAEIRDFSSHGSELILSRTANSVWRCPSHRASLL